MIIGIVLLGFVFGTILQYARLNRYNVISGMALLKNLTVAKAIAVAIGVGAILFAVEVGLENVSHHINPILPEGIVPGGILFGIGMQLSLSSLLVAVFVFAGLLATGRLFYNKV